MQVEFKAPYIITFLRDENNNRIIERIHTNEFPPYFYVKKTEEIPNDSRILRVEDTSKKSIFGEELNKIIVKEVYDVPKLRMLFFQTFEADIKFTNRYFIDRIKDVRQEKLRKCYFDLETVDMPSTQMDNQPITCIGVYDNYTSKYFTFIIDEEESIEERENHTIYYCVGEEMVLNKFIDHVRDFDYDMMIAHNSARFDNPVLIGRIQKLSIMNYGRMSPIGIVKRDNSFGEWRSTIGGRIMFDFLGTKTNYGIKGGIKGLLDGRDLTIKENGEEKIIRIKRWGLDQLAPLVGMKKGEMGKIQTLEDMIVYNKQDVKIMVELDKFFNVTEYYHNIQILIGCLYENTYFNTLMIDNFLLKRYSQYAFPTKPARGKFDNDSTIEGALVDDPIQGLYSKLYVIDQTSLYPSTIVSGNLSPEKLNPEGNIDIGNGLRFDDSSVGIIPDAVKFLLDIRLKYKKLAKTEPDAYKAQMFDLLSNGYKILLVSFYGALLYKGFRLYEHSIAESIPYLGRVIKRHVRDICEAHGYLIIFGDTDSSALYPKSDKATPIDDLVDIINKSFDQFALDRGMKKHIFHIELDKVYAPIIVSDVKKRYVGFLEKNDKKIYKATGFESVRRDTALVTELMQESIFKMILEYKSKKEVDAFIEELKEKRLSGEIPLIWFALPKGFSKAFGNYKVENLWVRGVQYSNKNLGTHFDHFSDISAFHIKSVPDGKPFTDIVCIDRDTINILDGYTIDWKVQLDKTIDSKYENIKKMLGWEDIKQMKLGDF